jgi:endonuclease/exonuclease/phosphatase family metal-dependent hydrolase
MPQSNTRKKVRVLSLNVKMLPGPFGEQWKDERRAKAIASQLGDYDIVCLQEVFDEEVRDIFTKAAKAGGYKSIVSTLHDDWLHEDSGLFFASKLPIGRNGRAYGYEEFKDTAFLSSDSLADKGIFYARMDLGSGKSLVVFHTHMQADEGPGDNKGVRAKQFEQIRRFMVRGLQKERRLKKTAAIFLGDFNVIAEAGGKKNRIGHPTAEYREAIARLMDPVDLFRETHPNSPGYTWDGPGNPRTGRNDDDLQRLDYLLAMKQIPVQSSAAQLKLLAPEVDKVAVEKLPWKGAGGVARGPLSDHYGLSAVLAV